MRGEASGGGGVPPPQAVHRHRRNRCSSTQKTKSAAFDFRMPPGAPSTTSSSWTFSSSEALCRAGKFGKRPDVQQRIAEAPTTREAAAIGRTPGLGIDPAWNAQRIDVMGSMMTMKREANAAAIDAALADTGNRPIVEVSTHDPWWGHSPSPTATRAGTSSVASG